MSIIKNPRVSFAHSFRRKGIGHPEPSDHNLTAQIRWILNEPVCGNSHQIGNRQLQLNEM
jgi:hypothetical protein